MKQFARCALALMLAAVSGVASALGLGEIVVRSSLDQPLLAEIPIISSDPAELEQLQAQLASPETFARVGLQPPQGVVSDLRFMVGLDNAGNPVVRVTSVQPVDQAALTFLVEVDWGQGRLVREYSALLDTPRTVSAPVQPPIEAPEVGPSNTIEREPEVEVAGGDAPEDTSEDTPEEPVDAVADTSEAAAPPVVETADTKPAPRPAVAAPARPVVQGGDYRIAGGDTLSEIASRMPGAHGLSLNQRMIALLQANPDAFIDGNIHKVKAGAVLRVPGADTIAALDRVEVDALVREQTRQWRQPVAAVPQPAVARSPGSQSAGSKPADPQSTGSTAQAAADARLEIVPTGASDATRAGNQSGISAGGEGNMLRQDIQTQETLAAREAELEEMKARVAELEKLQEQQQKLIELKDTELAEAQHQLAQAEPAKTEEQGSAMPWVWGGLGLLLVALVGGWLLRRRSVKPVFRAPDSDSRPSVADDFAASGAATADEVDGAEAEFMKPAETGDAGSDAVEPAIPAGTTTGLGAETAETAEAAEAAEAEDGIEFEPAATWGAPLSEGGTPASHVDPAEEPAFAENPADGAVGDGAGGNDRLELARAYLALGDRDSARQLLEEVRVHGDLAARQQATRMLRELG